MIKLDLNVVASEFESINDEHPLFYNKETGEFDYYVDPVYSGIEDDIERFEEACWIAAPSQYDINEYDIMTDFAYAVSDRRKKEILSLALQGRGAFRRFKDTVYILELSDEWYAFRHRALVEIAKEWCEFHKIPYFSNEDALESLSDRGSNTSFLKNVTVISLSKKNEEGAIEVLRDALGYTQEDATRTIREMMKSNRIRLIAIADIEGDKRVVGIIGAIPQYGMTGWELHPLAVLSEYQRRGIGSLLVETLEKEVAKRGGIMVYLGSDDEHGTTSLYGVDLYDDTFSKIENIRNIGDHPYTFYEKMGYKIVGVFPDANGIGKPDIWMAKRITQGDDSLV